MNRHFLFLEALRLMYERGCALLLSDLSYFPNQALTLTTVDRSLPANPVNDRRVANAVTLKSTFCLP